MFPRWSGADRVGLFPYRRMGGPGACLRTKQEKRTLKYLSEMSVVLVEATCLISHEAGISFGVDVIARHHPERFGQSR